MGAYNSTYVGIYLEVPITKETIKNTIYLDNKGRKTKNKFDPETGQPNQEKFEDVIKEVHPKSYITDNSNLGEDTFFTPEYTGSNKVNTFLLNRKDEYSYTNDDLFNMDLSSVDIPKLIDGFKNKYSAYLTYYKEKYGNFQIKWGVVHYAH